MTPSIDRLFVIWGDPIKGRRHVVGHLSRSLAERTVRFWYEDDLDEAISRGFRLLPEFPEKRGASFPYSARYLFAIFAERIPSPDRSDRSAMLARWDVRDHDDPFEVLAKSGGIRATDRLELAEYRSPTDDLQTPLELRVAGRRHLPDPAPLAKGDHVTLVCDPANEADPAAVYVMQSGKPAGYVPRHYSALISRLLDMAVPLHGAVMRELLVPDDVGRWVIRVSRT